MFLRPLTSTIHTLQQSLKAYKYPLSKIINTSKVNYYVPSRDLLCRKFSTSSEISLEKLDKVHFEEFQILIKDSNVTVIDVRQPEELVEHGALPRAINIPLGEVEEALKNMPEEQFFKKYGHKKPQKNTPIVFSCMRGIRSEKAQIEALKLNYENVKNYLGGWVEWAEKTKK